MAIKTNKKLASKWKFLIKFSGIVTKLIERSEILLKFMKLKKKKRTYKQQNYYYYKK